MTDESSTFSNNQEDAGSLEEIAAKSWQESSLRDFQKDVQSLPKDEYMQQISKNNVFNILVQWYDEVRKILDSGNRASEAQILDLKIEELTRELNSQKLNEYITNTMKTGYSLHTYSIMYGVCLQSIIDKIESEQNPFANALWRIKAGYSKLINAYMMKIKELDYENEMMVSLHNLHSDY